jgi:glycosyltransferase involved in cell wall biosynthesis
MDALVHLSTREGFGRALPQALAAGRPVVAYNCDGAAEVCRTGETGFLIEPSDRVGLARAILALATDEALRQRLGLAGGEFVKLNFAVEKMVENLYQLYLRLLENLPRAVERIRR